LIVPQKNVEQLAIKMTELFDNQALRENLGKNGRAFVLQHYDWNIISQRYHDLLNKMSIF